MKDDPLHDPAADAAANLLEAAFFGSSADEPLDQASVDLSSDLPLVEGYKLIRLLGEGGFGMVYEAEQRAPIRRPVALKVLRPGCATRELLVRFEQERQALALMNHPHIARIYDAGETEDGRPFIAMELVNGSTIDRQAKPLPLREKVALMLDVCRAVAHAHHKGIIHRDLKPSNILVSVSEQDQLEPRIIDFGIAKALDGPLVTKVMFTQMRQIVGTPGYMSPERQHTSQISHSADTRTDVFALGAIFWELLTGRTPVQSPDGGTTRVTLPGIHGIPDELRWITEKATDPDMERRYANADGLADDLAAWLEGMPLKAAPRSTTYVIAKWAVRHRALALTGLALVVTLLASLILVTHKNSQIGHALRQAELNHTETLRRTANESYLMGMTRERRRPVLAQAHWAHALRQDPQNQAALGIALATVQHRSYTRPAAPATSMPEGKVMLTALSADGMWAAIILQTPSGEVLVRARRGEVKGSAHPVPADGRMTLLAVSNQGHVALAAPRGPVGLLQKDGTWSASGRDVEGLRFIAWTPEEQLWCVEVETVSRCDQQGRPTGPRTDLTGREWRSAATEDGRFLAVGIEAGRILVFDSRSTAPPQEVRAPIPAPFSAMGISADGKRIAAAWRSGDVWVHRGDGSTSAYRSGEAILHLVFQPGTSALILHRPSSLGIWDLGVGGPGRTIALKDPLKTLLPVGASSLLMQSNFGRPTLLDLAGKGVAEDLPGIEGRVHCASTAGGTVVLMADEDASILEWLSLHAPAATGTPVNVSRTWLALTPAAGGGGWHGVDSTGSVSHVMPDGKAHERWRTDARQLRLAAVDATGTTALVDVQGAPGVFVVRQGQSIIQPWGKPSSLALSADAQFAALGYPGGEVRVFDVATSRELLMRDWQRGAVSAISFIGSDRIAFAAFSQVRVWDWRQDRVLPTPIDLTGNITALAPCSAGARMAATGDDATLHVIDVASGRRIVGLLPAPARTASLAWTPGDTEVRAFGESSMIRTPMPPLLKEAPPWLATWLEHHVGMKVDDQGRAVRLRARTEFPLPAGVEPRLKAWLSL